jgi:IrrE N-terminal-like domain
MADHVSPSDLIAQLKADYPALVFSVGNSFCWSPSDRHIMYRTDVTDIRATYSLLHEVGHALLEHKRYRQDFELLQLEVAAWEKAKQLAPSYSVQLDEDHIQDCLDTYRDWLYRRSICPSCTTKALQLDSEPTYRCHNCQATWRVAPSRFCRPYRQQNRLLPAAA